MITFKTAKERETPDDFDNKFYFKYFMITFIFPYIKNRKKSLWEHIKF